MDAVAMVDAVVMVGVVATGEVADDADAVALRLPALVAAVLLPSPLYSPCGNSARGGHNIGGVRNNPYDIPCAHGDDATCHADERLHL